jgi:aspartate/methionine/tyrosine aminotransferase
MPSNLAPTPFVLQAPTVWEEFTPLAREQGAVNLGQGFPDWPTPAFVKAAAVRALDENFNQVRKAICFLHEIP